jgi:hypothetical protein
MDRPVARCFLAFAIWFSLAAFLCIRFVCSSGVFECDKRFKVLPAKARNSEPQTLRPGTLVPSKKDCDIKLRLVKQLHFLVQQCFNAETQGRSGLSSEF